MAIYGFVRHSRLKKEKLADGQVAEMAKKAEELGGSLKTVFVDPGSPGKETAVLKRPAGKEMLEALRAGDTLIVNGLDRLGYSMRDVQKTVEALAKRDVRIYLLRALGGEFDLAPAHSRIFLGLFALWAKTEKALRSERATEAAQSRKENGRAYCNPPMARKIVNRDGVKMLEWDEQQLRYIAEIAERLPKEGPEKVAQDFWNRKIKDRRGRLWGRQKPKLFSRYRTPYQQFHRAARWFHRMKRKGLLPPPYGELALTMQEPKRFREEPKPKKWTPGGTTRREQERAALKAKHRAERLARWQAEKAARLQSRVHKPMLAPQPKEGTARP
jgi:DNA invertase Pin-like site-specific DNA recombinase